MYDMPKSGLLKEVEIYEPGPPYQTPHLLHDSTLHNRRHYSIPLTIFEPIVAPAPKIAIPQVRSDSSKLG